LYPTSPQWSKLQRVLNLPLKTGESEEIEEKIDAMERGELG
jgi:hypothetical protein